MSRAKTGVQRYWNVDGLHEIAVALIFTLTAAWLWATDIATLPRPWKGALSFAFPAMLWTVMLGERRAVDAVRRRLTVPRAGFVAFRKPTVRKRIVTGLAAMSVAAAIALLAARETGDVKRWLVAFLGLASGAFLFAMGSKSGHQRFYFAGVALALSGLGVSISGADFEHAMVWFCLLAGFVMLVSGGITLWRFLHTPAEE